LFFVLPDDPALTALDTRPGRSYAQGMEVQFAPEVQARLDQLATETGRAKDEFVQDAMAGYFDELERTRQMLDSRYDDVKSGRVTPIDGEEAFARLREKSEARRNSRA
jgi:predicted DNA-binding protein